MRRKHIIVATIAISAITAGVIAGGYAISNNNIEAPGIIAISPPTTPTITQSATGIITVTVTPTEEPTEDEKTNVGTGDVPEIVIPSVTQAAGESGSDTEDTTESGEGNGSTGTQDDVTVTPGATGSVTETPEVTIGVTATAAPTITGTSQPTSVPTSVPSATETVKPTATLAPTATLKPTVTPRPTVTPTPRPTATPKPTATPIPVSKELTAGGFAKIIFNVMGITLAEDTEANAYETAINYGFITSDIFQSASSKVLYKNAYVVLYNIAQYLGVEADKDILTAVVERGRISDLSGTTTEKAAMQFLLATGIVEGESDGKCSKTRSFEPKDTISSTDAELYAKRVVNADKRAVISPDGQVCRTTNLPVYARFFPYILDSYPNEYYDFNFRYMRQYSSFEDGVDEYGDPNYVEDLVFNRWTDGVDYYSPATIHTWNYKLSGKAINFGELRDEKAAEWEKQVEEHLMLIFNADYRTTPNDSAWANKVLQGLYNYGTKDGDYAKERMEVYLKDMKENKTIVVCDQVSADCSTMYTDGSRKYIRVYVHYKIESALNFNEYGVSPIIYQNYSRWSQTYRDVTFGQWRDGYIDVEVMTTADRIVDLVAPADGYLKERLVAE